MVPSPRPHAGSLLQARDHAADPLVRLLPGAAPGARAGASACGRSRSRSRPRRSSSGPLRRRRTSRLTSSTRNSRRASGDSRDTPSTARTPTAAICRAPASGSPPSARAGTRCATTRSPPTAPCRASASSTGQARHVRALRSRRAQLHRPTARPRTFSRRWRARRGRYAALQAGALAWARANTTGRGARELLGACGLAPLGGGRPCREMTRR